MRRHQETKRKGSSKNQFENKKFDTVLLRFTVPLKCKLTVSTRFSIFEVFENRVSVLSISTDGQQKASATSLIYLTSDGHANTIISKCVCVITWCPECWKWHFRTSRFLNFLGKHAPRPPKVKGPDPLFIQSVTLL